MLVGGTRPLDAFEARPEVALHLKASIGDFTVGFIGAVNGVAVDEYYLRSIGFVQVGLFAGAGNIVGQ